MCHRSVGLKTPAQGYRVQRLMSRHRQIRMLPSNCAKTHSKALNGAPNHLRGLTAYLFISHAECLFEASAITVSSGIIQFSFAFPVLSVRAKAIGVAGARQQFHRIVSASSGRHPAGMRPLLPDDCMALLLRTRRKSRLARAARTMFQMCRAPSGLAKSER